MRYLYELFLVVHLFTLFMLVALTFVALVASRPERRKFSLMWSGILSVVVFVTGFGLLGLRQIGFEGWVIVKLACWLALAVMAPLAFRRPEQKVFLLVLASGAILLATVMVILRPL